MLPRPLLPSAALFSLVLAAVCLLTPAQAEEAPPEKLLKTEAPIVIDGKLDDPAWAKATPVSVDFTNTKTGVKSDSPRAVVKYSWDDRYLYIGYETFDANLVALASNETQGPEQNRRPGCAIHDPKGEVKVDVVEFFLSFGDEHFFWELHHNALNQFNDVWCVSVDPSWPIAKTTMSMYDIIFQPNEWLPDEGESTVAMAVHLKPKADGAPSTVNDASDTDTGYTAELRLPWRSIGAPTAAATWIENKPAPRTPGPWKMAGRTVSLLAVMQDGDLKERYYHSSPTKKPGWFHKSQPDWPRYLFAAP